MNSLAKTGKYAEAYSGSDALIVCLSRLFMVAAEFIRWSPEVAHAKRSDPALKSKNPTSEVGFLKSG